MEIESSNTSEINPRELKPSFISSPAFAPFCVSWSKDNKISVVVEGGVFIFELWPMPLADEQTVTFSKSWIPANPATPLSNAVVDNENGAFLWSLDRKQVYEATLDSTLCTAVQKPSGTSVSAYVVFCEFSPLVGCKSYFSCLTNHGVLEIYKGSLKNWTPVINVTQLWIMHCNSKETLKNVNYDSFKSEMSRLKISTMKWVQEPEVQFMTGHENGEIVLWKVDLYKNLIMNVTHCLKANGKPICLNLSRSSIKKSWYLFVGMSSGVVKCLTVDITTGAVTGDISLWKFEDSLLPSRIITKFLFYKCFVFVVKRHVLLIQSLSEEKRNKCQSKIHCEEFPAAITGWDEYQDYFVICLQNHDVYLFTVEDIDNKIVYRKKKIEMEIKKKHLSIYSCFGFTMSVNKAIWILVCAPKVNYNPMKDITQMMMFTPEVKVFRSLSDKTSSGLIEKILKEYEDICLNEIFDLLELKKLELLADAEKFRKDYVINEDLPLVHLQLMLWEVKLKLFCNYTDQESLVNELEFSITKNRAKKVVATLERFDSLDLMEKKSLDMCKFFLINGKDKSKPLNELCSICDSESFLYNIRVSSCSNLHKFPRCCLSLLPCDTVPYAICRNCESVALTNFVIETDDRCPFCDGLLDPDERFRIFM